MSLLTLLEAANFLDSTEANASVPRDAAANVELQRSPQILSPDLRLDFGVSTTGSSPQGTGPDAPAGRRSGGAGTREVHNKLEKYRRAQLKECFANLRLYINVAENRKLSNLSILRLAIRHIKSLNESYTHLRKVLSKEKFEQVALKKAMCQNQNFEIPSSVDNISVVSPTSASTDTASDENDDFDKTETSEVKAISKSSDAVPVPSPNIVSDAGASNIILFCQALPPAVTSVSGTIVIPPIISANRLMVPFKAEDLAPSGTPVTSPEVLSTTVSAIATVNSLPPGTVATKETIRAGVSSRGSGARTAAPRTSSETAPGFTLHGGNSRPVVQMLQQTITQRAIVQQERQRQLMSQTQEERQKPASDKGSTSTVLKKLTAPSSAMTSSSHRSLLSQHLSSSSVSLTSTPTLSTATSSVQLKFPMFHTSSLVTALSKSSDNPAATVPDSNTKTVANTSTQQVLLPFTSLAGTGLSEAKFLHSGVFLQLMSQGQLGAIQAYPSDDVTQSHNSQLITVYPMVPTIPLTQLFSPLAATPSNIPVSSAELS